MAEEREFQRPALRERANPKMSTPALLTCAACGAELPPAAKFCPQCGHPLAAPDSVRGAQDVADPILAGSAVPEAERKLVTVLFADLKGSMELIAERDPEEAQKLLDPILDRMCAAVEKYGGTVNQVMGDGIMALFGAPVSLEDHAVRACLAALSMQDLVRHYGDDIQRAIGVPVQIRVGLNSGEVVLKVSGHGFHLTYTAVGQAVHVAARMEQIAKPGSVMATAETVRLATGHVEARSVGPVTVKGIERPVEAAEIGWASTRRSRFYRAPVRAMTPFVGRDTELSRLLDAYAQVANGGAGRLAVVVGEPGIGKSRLIHEFLRAIAGKGALALDGGEAPYSSGAGYRPGVHILRQYFDIADTDDVKSIQEKVAGRIVALNGGSNSEGVPLLALLRALPDSHRFYSAPIAERRQRIFTALMWLGRRMAADRPLVLAYEDLQWMTSDTRDFLDAFSLELPSSTLAVLTYRSDYDASWLTNRGHLEIRLKGLPPDVAHQIFTELAGDDESLSAVKDDLVRRSGGNPLFIEEYVRNLAESGELVGQPGHYRAGTRHDSIVIPPTVRAVLAARIDRLSLGDKHVLQTLAAVGESASIDLLERVSGLRTDELRRSLRRMESGGLLVERTDREKLAYEFQHSLTQAVAYESLLHERRRELHLSILAVLRGSQEFDVLARHAVMGEAWDQALTYLREAGRVAAQLGSIEAIGHFEHALGVLKRLPVTERTLETMFDLHCDLRNALVPLGPQPRLLEVLQEALRIAEKLGDDRRLAQVHSFLSNYYGTVGSSDLALAASERSLVLAERVGAVNLLIAGSITAGEIYRTLGDYPKAQRFLSRAIVLIDPAEEQEFSGQVGLPSVRARSHLAWTLAELGDFPSALLVAAEALREADASSHPYSICHASLGQAGTWVRQGEFESAIEVLARGFAISEQVPLLRPSIAADLGLAHARCGRIAEGLSHLGAAVEGAMKLGRLSRLPLLLVKCGEVHLLAGEPDKALLLATTALRRATEQKERGNEAYARHLLGEISALVRPAAVEAEQHYLEALDLATELSMRPLAARCQAGLGRLYSQQLDPQKARDYLRTAMTMYRDMGMRYWQEQVERESGK